MLRSIALVFGFMFGTAVAAQEPSFELKGVAFPDSAYLTEAELQAVTDPYMNRPITFPDVQQMLADVQLLYTSAGVVTAQVILPPQDVADGILRLDLVEATIGAVAVDLTETDPEFITRRLTLQPGVQPDYDQIAADIRMFELAYDLRPTLSFAPGDAFGTSNVSITAEEPERWGWVASVDNFAAESLGRWQGTVSGQVRSLTGQRDTLSFSLGLGEGIKEGTLGYTRPIGGNGGAVFGSVTVSQTEVVDGDFSVLDVVTDKSEARFGYQRLGFVTDDSYWRFSGDFRYTSTAASLLGEDLQDTTLQELNSTARYHRSFDTASLNAGATLSLGRTESGNAASTDGDFQVLTGNLTYARAVGSDWVVEMAMRGQYTRDDALPSAKLFTLGSLTSLRGYPDGVLSGVSGLDMRLQVTRRPQQISESQPDFTWAPFAFFDAGAVKPVADDSDITTAQSVGVGVRGTYSEKVSMIAMVGTPLADIDDQDIPEGAKVYFGLDYNF